MRDSELIPNQSVGKYELGMTWRQVKQLLSQNYVKEQRGIFMVVWLNGTIGFWFHKPHLVLVQILVQGSYGGRVLHKVGINDSLADIEYYFGEVYFDGFVWRTQAYPRVGFELSNLTIYDNKPLRAKPIEAISVFY